VKTGQVVSTSCYNLQLSLSRIYSERQMSQNLLKDAELKTGVKIQEQIAEQQLSQSEGRVSVDDP
jgi:hypothetical protein